LNGGLKLTQEKNAKCWTSFAQLISCYFDVAATTPGSGGLTISCFNVSTIHGGEAYFPNASLFTTYDILGRMSESKRIN